MRFWSAGISKIMQPSSAAVLCTLLVAIISVAHIPCSYATTTAAFTLSAGSGEMLMAKVKKMEMLGEVIREKTVSSSLAPNPNPQAVCGVDTSLPSGLINVCKIFMQFPQGVYVCSGWVVSPNKVATAGHCVLGASGWTSAVIVICNGIQLSGTHVSSPQPYYDYVFGQTNNGIHWSSAGVIRLNGDLPSTIVPWQFVDASCRSKSASLYHVHPASSLNRYRLLIVFIHCCWYSEHCLIDSILEISGCENILAGRLQTEHHLNIYYMNLNVELLILSQHGFSVLTASGTDRQWSFFQMLIYLFLVYFDPINTFFDNTNKYFLGWPKRYFG